MPLKGPSPSFRGVRKGPTDDNKYEYHVPNASVERGKFGNLVLRALDSWRSWKLFGSPKPEGE
jgi:hypothetical protein